MTDLDGLSPERLELFLSSGVMLAIHGHGDNIEKLQAIESLLQQSSRIIATTQVKPHFPIINPGGFTDGDQDYTFVIIWHHQISHFSYLDMILGVKSGNFLKNRSNRIYR